mgnify:CR=1 FL=1
MKQEFIIDFIIRKPAKSFFKKHENIKEKFKNNIILHFKGQRIIDIKHSSKDNVVLYME